MVKASDVGKTVIFQETQCHKDCGELLAVDNNLAIIKVLNLIKVSVPVSFVWLMNENGYAMASDIGISNKD